MIHTNNLIRIQSTLYKTVQHSNINFSKQLFPAHVYFSTYRPRRSFLYMPGSSEKMLNKIQWLPQADSICMDLEDAVSHSKKSDARQLIVAQLNKLMNNSNITNEICVRINPIDSVYVNDDIDEILKNNTIHPHTIVVPKLQSVDQLHWIDSQLNLYDPHHNIQLIGLIESCQSLINLHSICSARNKRLVALIFGGDDYAADIGATRSSDSHELLYARHTILTYCKAFSLQAIDIVNIDFKNSTALRAECEYGNNIGYTGKQLIHPSQIDVCNNCYAPSHTTIQWAQSIITAADQHDEQGLGAFAFNDQMIDMPTIKSARKVIERAKACKLI